MTQANEIDSRLDRIEALTVEIAAANLRHDRAIDQNNTAIARHDEEFICINAILESNARLIQDLAIQQRETQTEMRSNINDLVSMMGTLSQNADRHWASIQEMQAEVRKLQIENSRILDRLEQHMSKGHGDQ
jgi:predicted nuclease with TOPRIM domain